MAESQLSYEERKRRQAENKQLARCLLKIINGYSEEERASFRNKLYAAGYSDEDMIQFRLAYQEQPDPPDVADEDFMEDFTDEQ